MEKKVIKIPIYHGQLVLIKYETTEELDKKYELNIPYAYDAVAFVDHYESGYTRYVLAMREVTIPKIAHEALHVVQMIMRDRGIVPVEVDETEAYLLQWVVDKACSFYIPTTNSG
jgi:hypothetical protein